LDSVVTANSATRGAGGVGLGPAPDGLPGNGYGGGIFIAGAQVELDGFTLAHVTGNSASTSDPNIHGEFDIIADPDPLPGDFNHDGAVDAADYVVWRKTDGTQTGYNTWRANFGATFGVGSGAAGYPLGASAIPQYPAVPEPSTVMLLILAAAGALNKRNGVRGESCQMCYFALPMVAS
jgi:hypothetical protein